MVGMATLDRLYTAILSDHLAHERQMAFLTGPRQVGKTTACRQIGDVYLDWDNQDDRELILAGPRAVAEHAGLDRLRERRPVVVMDEVHRYARWKTFLKGFFDTYQDRARIIVTGSSRLDLYRRGGDSLMGRYFLYRMHPLSVGELVHTDIPAALVSTPRPLAKGQWEALWTYGGYPEPFLRRDTRFSRRWHALRKTQLLKEDVRDLTRIQELDQLNTLAELLARRSGEQLVYGTLARDVRVAENTVRSWIGVLSNLHYGFLVRPWFRNVTRALRKAPKWYLRDWSGVEDEGRRAETFAACHLLKAVDAWTDLGLGQFELRYVRDKEQREADFLIVRDGKPWLLAEIKHKDTRLSPALEYMQRQTRSAYAFQVVTDLSYVDRDCMTEHDPVIVPASTLFSQIP